MRNKRSCSLLDICIIAFPTSVTNSLTRYSLVKGGFSLTLGLMVQFCMAGNVSQQVRKCYGCETPRLPAHCSLLKIRKQKGGNGISLET